MARRTSGIVSQAHRERVPRRHADAGVRVVIAAFLHRFARRTFPLWERLGLHVTPVRYDQPIPDTRSLDDDVWTDSELPGIDMKEEYQIALLEEFVARYCDEYTLFPRTEPLHRGGYYVANGAFESVDGEVLYCMIRSFKPHRIIEIGSGYSTLAASSAIVANRHEDPSYRCNFISVDPFPPDLIASSVPGLSGQLPVPVQDVPLSEFLSLGNCDILFVDSSHVLRTGSDVQYEFLEILPRVAAGVLVHIHDIFLPAEYPRSWLLEHRRFWNEQYLLQGFLVNNSEFEVMWGASYMHLNHPDLLERAFPSYDKDETWPGSFWMRRLPSNVRVSPS